MDESVAFGCVIALLLFVCIVKAWNKKDREKQGDSISESKESRGISGFVVCALCGCFFFAGYCFGSISVESKLYDEWHDGYNKGFDVGKRNYTSPSEEEIERSYQEKTSGEFRVTANTEIIYNNSVGNDWNFEIIVGGNEPPTTIQAKVGDRISVYVQAEEEDSSPDISYWDGYVEIEAGDFENGFTVPIELYVTEDYGRYSGNDAKIEFELFFDPA